jgi:hypothetical protein
MTFAHLVRRLHLYMGLFLLPWVIMFGVSSIPLNHSGTPEPAIWTRVGEIDFDNEVPASGENLRPLGRSMMDAAGIEGGYYINRLNASQINVNHPNFLQPVRIIYHADRKALVVEQLSPSLRQFVSALHTRGGYDMGGTWDSIWAVFVDLLSVGLILWIATGFYMWWQLPSTRTWGWLAVSAGAVCFAVLMATL